MLISSRRVVLKMLPWIALIHVIIFMAFWLTNGLFYSEVNDYLTDLLGRRADYVSLCLLISGVVGLWSVARGWLVRVGWQHRLAWLTGWLYGIVALIYLVFFYGSFWLLLGKSPVQVPRLGQMLLYYRLVLDPVALVAVTLLASLWLKDLLSAQKQVGVKPYALTLAPVVVFYLLLWAIPIVSPPDSVYAGALPAKPQLIAHRGASMIAPENTLAAFERAAALHTFGVETDICLSRDGTPFLMHDDNLKRTTNVAAVFPGRVKDAAENFTLPELKQLNAGEWFVNADPYQSIARGAVSAAEVDQFRRQAIPTLDPLLEIVRQNKLVFIFDLKESPGPSSSHQALFDLVLRQIHQAGIDSQVWFLVDRDQLAQIRAAAPQMLPAYGVDFRQPPEPAMLVSQGYQIVNAEYGLSKEWMAKYHAAGLWVNLYTIDEPWQFSRLWLLGVDSTTSSNAHTLVALDYPLLGMPYSSYLVFWTVIGIMGLGTLFGFTWHATRSQKP